MSRRGTSFKRSQHQITQWGNSTQTKGSFEFKERTTNKGRYYLPWWPGNRKAQKDNHHARSKALELSWLDQARGAERRGRGEASKVIGKDKGADRVEPWLGEQVDWLDSCSKG